MCTEGNGGFSNLNIPQNGLFKNNKAVACLDNKTSNAFEVSKGVRHGYILQPRLFKIYGEYIMTRALDKFKGKVAINGMNNLRYADGII